MHDLSFDIQWEAPRGVNGPELAATWATLRIRAGDSVVTQVFDSQDNRPREHLRVPVYPLAEWIATNWWFLNHEFLNPVKEGDAEFHRRHSLSSGREGYAYPDLEVISSGERTNIIWKKKASPWSNVKFTDAGSIWLEKNEFQEACVGLIQVVIERLESMNLDDTLLHHEWAAIRTADEEESAFCAAAAGLGWDPFAIDDTQREQVILTADRLGDLIDEAIPALDATLLDSSALAIETAAGEAKRHSLELLGIQDLMSHSQSEVTAGVSPWDQGYRLARRLRQVRGLDNEPLPDMCRIADALSEDVQSIESVMSPIDSLARAPLIEGLITRNDNHAPAFAFQPFSDERKRFHFCRALAEVLTAPHSDSLITKARSGRQRRNRAFAAEFLAPAAALANSVSSPFVDANDIEDMAETFGVSTYVIDHQISNHGIANIWRE